MIRHHEGAVDMVEDLLDKRATSLRPRAAGVGDIKSDQAVEVCPDGLLVGLSDDPRANLKAGLMDAGIAIKNMTWLPLFLSQRDSSIRTILSRCRKGLSTSPKNTGREHKEGGSF